MKKIKNFLQGLRQLNRMQYKLVLEAILVLNLIVLMIWFNDFSRFSIFMYASVFIFLTGVIILLPKIIDKVVLFLSLSALYIYYISQEIYYSAFQQYYLFNTALGAKDEVAGVSSSVMELITTKVYWVLFLLVILLIFFCLFNTKEKISTKMYLQSTVVSVICFVISGLILGSMSLILDKQKEDVGILYYYGTPHYFFNYLPNSNVVVEEFGKIGLFYRDSIGRVLLQNDSQFGIDDDLIIEVLDAIGKQSENNENEYTGIFEGKNLLIIQAESLMNMAIDENLTPTLYRMKEEGISFNMFNAPLLYGSTSDTEFMIHTGLFPVSTGEITFNEYNQNTYPTTLAKAFNEQSYYSSGYHSNYENYYSRDVMYPQLGYEFFDMLKINIPVLELDSVTLDKIKWMYNWSENWYSFFVTYNGHQPYTLDSCGNSGAGIEPRPYDEGFYETIEAYYPDADESVKCYYAKNMDLDKGIERYIEDIQNNDFEIVIVVVGDHYAKALPVDHGIETYTPFIIWEKNIEKKEIEKRASTIDIFPTLANMFNLEYDARTVFGQDLMSDEYQGTYFNSFGQIVTNDFIYNSSTNEIELYTDRYTEEEAWMYVNEYILRMNVSRTIVETDFFSRYPEYGHRVEDID